MQEVEEMRARYAKLKEMSQRQPIFRTNFKCQGKVCKMIIDNGSFDNIVSMEMVEKLNLSRKPHETPYRAYWVNDDQWVDVREQAFVDLNIGSYHDTILCDVMPLKDFHLILGKV